MKVFKTGIKKTNRIINELINGNKNNNNNVKIYNTYVNESDEQVHKHNRKINQNSIESEEFSWWKTVNASFFPNNFVTFDNNPFHQAEKKKCAEKSGNNYIKTRQNMRCARNKNRI